MKDIEISYGRKDIDENGILTNICADNRPPDQTSRSWGTHSEETKQLFREQRAWYKGKNYEERYGEEKAKEIRTKLKGKIPAFKGKKHTYETRRIMSIKSKNRKPRLNFNHTEESKRKLQLNNPKRRAIHTPEGEFISIGDYLQKNINITVTEVGLRNLFKDSDKIITVWRVAQSKLLTKDDIGKTPRELGYYYI